MSDHISLGDVIRLKRGTTYKGLLLGNIGPVLLGLGSIARNGGFKEDKLQQYGGDSDPSIILTAGDLYVALKDVTQSADLLGAVARLPRHISAGRLTQDTVGITITNGRITSDYLYWILRTPQYRSYCREHATGTTNLGLSRDDFLAFEFPVSSKARTELVQLLGASEEKIAANLSAVRKACDLAQALFEAVGNGVVEYQGLGEIVSISKGVSYRSVDLEEGDTALVTLKSVTRHGTYSDSGLKPFLGPYSASQVVKPGEIVVAQTDLTQAAEVVGRAVRIAPTTEFAVLVASLDLVVVRPNGHVPVEYLYGVLSQERFRRHCQSRTSGTTVLHLASDAIRAYEAPMAARELQEQFASTIRPLHTLVDSLNQENRVLRLMRDTLLPQLMSDKLRVRDAEKQVEEVL